MPQGKVAVIPPCIAIHRRSAMLPLALQLYAQHPDVCTARRDVFTRAYALGPPCWTLGFRWDIHYFYSVSTSDLIYDPSGWHLPSRSYGLRHKPRSFTYRDLFTKGPINTLSASNTSTAGIWFVGSFFHQDSGYGRGEIAIRATFLSRNTPLHTFPARVVTVLLLASMENVYFQCCLPEPLM